MITSWEQMTLSVLREIERISVSDKSEHEKNIEITAVLSGKPVDELKTMPAVEFNAYLKQGLFMNELPKPNLPATSIVLNGTKYNVTTVTRDITAAQFIDYQLIQENYGKTSNSKLENTEKLMACFFVPDGHMYNDGKYDIEKVYSDIYNHLPITMLLGYTNFFTLQFRASYTAILKSLRRNLWKNRSLTKEQKKELKKYMNTLIYQMDRLPR